MQKFNGVTVANAKHGRSREKAARPFLMHGQSAKQTSAVGQLRKKRLEVTLDPTLKGALSDTLERVQQADCHQFAGMKIGLRMFGNFLHGVVRAAKQFGDKICCGHGIGSSERVILPV